MRRSLVASLITLAALIVAAPAAANVHISHGQTVNEIRAIGQDVRVDGNARGPVIIIGGNLTVGPHGQAANITVIGGAIRSEPGSRLRGDVFQFGGAIPEINGWLLAVVLLSLLAVRALLACGAVTLGRKLARTRYQPILSSIARDRPTRLFTAGILATAGLLAFSIICLITIAGALVTLIIWGLLIAALIVGISVLDEPVSEMGFGRGIYGAVAVPVIGDALLALALTVGVGVILRRLSSSRQAPIAAVARQ